jgi:hypothetical protein
MGDNGSGNNNFAIINVVVSLCSLVSIAQKRRKKNNKQIGTNKDPKKKHCNLGPLGNRKEGF